MRIAVMATGAVGGYFGARRRAHHRRRVLHRRHHRRARAHPSFRNYAEAGVRRVRRVALAARAAVPWLSGDVVERGARLGVATPCNRAINDILPIYSDGRAATGEPPGPASPARPRA